jgi:signal peptidase II
MHNLKWGFLSLVIVVLDQLTKHYALAHLTLYQPIPLLSVLSFTLAFNNGAAFSFLSGDGGWHTVFFVTLTVCITVSVLVYLMRTPAEKKWQGRALALILGGAIGNIVDRIHYGYVIDFIDAHIGPYHWPIFNAADMAISVGVLILVFTTFKKQQ